MDQVAVFSDTSRRKRLPKEADEEFKKRVQAYKETKGEV